MPGRINPTPAPTPTSHPQAPTHMPAPAASHTDTLAAPLPSTTASGMATPGEQCSWSPGTSAGASGMPPAGHPGTEPLLAYGNSITCNVRGCLGSQMTKPCLWSFKSR